MARKKLLPVRHTGKIVHHRHTSYGSLALVLLLAVATMIGMSRSVALAAATDPVNSSESVYAVVPAAIPKLAPSINNITVGTVFDSPKPVPIQGTCQNKTLVELFKNNVFAGAALCSGDQYSLQIDLFLGTNALVARAYNANNIAGPDSPTLVVNQTSPDANPNNSVTTNEQFFVTSTIDYKGVGVGDSLSWPLTISGGQAPYAISVSWGDGKSDLYSRGTAEPFTIQHVYDQPGSGPQNSYNVTITASDQQGAKSFIQLVTIVSGDSPGIVNSVSRGYNLSGALRIGWKVLAGAVLLVLTFWLGERREAFIVRRATTRRAW